MKNEHFVIERTYNAPVARVWKAITDKDQMKEWYFDIPEFKPEKDFEFQFYGEDGDCNKFLHLCKILEVIPNKKLSHTWHYEGFEGNSVVTIELFDDEGKTKLKLTHEGLDTFPALPAFSRENFTAGWTEIMGTSLPEFVETGYAEKAVEINATSNQVWTVLTQPEYTKQWAKAFCDGTTVTSGWQVGDLVTWYMPNGSVAAKGVITECQPGIRLRISFYDDVNDAPPTATGEYYEQYELTENGNQSSLKITSGPIAKKYLKQHDPMWDKAVQFIKELSETKPVNV